MHVHMKSKLTKGTGVEMASGEEKETRRGLPPPKRGLAATDTGSIPSSQRAAGEAGVLLGLWATSLFLVSML